MTPPRAVPIHSGQRLKPLSRKAFNRRLAKIGLPGPASVSVSRELPFEAPDNFVAGVIDQTIYAPDGLDRMGAAHETFHVLQQAFSDADKAIIMKRLGMTGEWDPATGKSPHERAADWYAAAIQRMDPGSMWSDDYYYAKKPPKRRDLLRFARTIDRLGDRYGLPDYQRPR